RSSSWRTTARNHYRDFRGKGDSSRPRNSVRLAVEELEARFVPSITATGTSVAPTEGQAFHGAVATFTDSDMNATVSNFTATVVWGDGTTTSGTVQAANGGFQVIGDHTYVD